MRQNYLTKVMTLLCFLFPFSLSAQWSSNITLANDYLFNGISQTDNKAALQAGITGSLDNGFYFGGWSSNVELANQADVELDAYIGYSHSLKNSISIDLGISQYTYHGKNNSDMLNYAELYLKWNFKNTDLNFWYSWDYFGTGARHYIVMLNHTFKISDDLSLLIGVDKSTSLDSNKWQWQANDKDYVHGQIAGIFSYQKLDFSLSIQVTDLDTLGETKLLFTVSKQFNW